MSGYSGALDRLSETFGRLPGIGAKTAERLAHHILKCPAEEALALAEAIREVKEKVRHCATCFHLTEADEALCIICRDPSRDPAIVCVVEQPRDLMALEGARSFRGVYHVLLGRLAPLQGMGPEQLTLDALETRVRSGSVREVIMATNPNLEGDGTALLVASRLEGAGVPITRLARGLASGSVLEFANREMLADALNGRQQF
ncbi:MAG: recombination mediator RecR [Isosphaeraceae bacterium]